jgi:3-methyladenine DNA glycosylase/8-oxoguanine DNA glycosylase
MAFDQKHELEEREAQEDELYAIFMGYTNADPIVEHICTHLEQQPLEQRYKNVIQKVRQTQKRIPKLAIILFAIWLCPELKIGKSAQPRRFEPFEAGIQAICMNILKGKFLSLQEFVTNAVTDYIVTPKNN